MQEAKYVSFIQRLADIDTICESLQLDEARSLGRTSTDRRRPSSISRGRPCREVAKCFTVSNPKMMTVSILRIFFGKLFDITRMNMPLVRHASLAVVGCDQCSLAAVLEGIVGIRKRN